MTQRELTRNGLKIDTIEIRRDTEKLNFSAVIFFISWMLVHSPFQVDTIFSLVVLLVISLFGLYHGLRMFLLLVKMDYIFFGQPIRDAESIAKWVVNLKYKSKTK